MTDTRFQSHKDLPAKHLLGTGTPMCAGCGGLETLHEIYDIIGEKCVIVNAAGCMTLCSFVFMVLAYISGDSHRAGNLLFPYIPLTGELAVLCGGMMGACLGFLWYNCHPASVFMVPTTA